MDCNIIVRSVETYIIKNQDHISKLRKKNYSKHRDKNLARSARWNRTLDGKIKSAYNSIICRVKTKSRHNAKTYYGLDFCSKQTFYNFSNNNIDLEYLMMKWKESNYDRRYAPSIDRITSSKGYVMGNMEWITLSDNVKRSWLKNNPDAKR